MKNLAENDSSSLKASSLNFQRASNVQKTSKESSPNLFKARMPNSEIERPSFNRKRDLSPNINFSAKKSKKALLNADSLKAQSSKSLLTSTTAMTKASAATASSSTTSTAFSAILNPPQYALSARSSEYVVDPQLNALNVQERRKQPYDTGTWHNSPSTMNEEATRYKGISGTLLCYVMNPTTSFMLKVRVLLDSGANVSFIPKATAKAIGLRGTPRLMSVNTVGGSRLVGKESEVIFKLVKSDQSLVSMPIVATTTEIIGNPFCAVDFNPKNHNYLKGIILADKYPDGEKSMDCLLYTSPSPRDRG